MKKPFPMEVGRIVLSKAGRDGGRAMMIFAVEDDTFVRVVDGDLRSIAKPKKKKKTHLTATPECISSLQEKLSRGFGILDAEVRAALTAAGYGQSQPRSQEARKNGKQ